MTKGNLSLCHPIRLHFHPTTDKDRKRKETHRHVYPLDAETVNDKQEADTDYLHKPQPMYLSFAPETYRTHRKQRDKRIEQKYLCIEAHRRMLREKHCHHHNAAQRQAALQNCIIQPQVFACAPFGKRNDQSHHKEYAGTLHRAQRKTAFNNLNTGFNNFTFILYKTSFITMFINNIRTICGRKH